MQDSWKIQAKLALESSAHRPIGQVLLSKVRHWYFASSNNAIVEIDGQGRTVWLPTYGHGCWRDLEVTDRLNEGLWQELGFETRMLRNFHPFAMNLGAVHCMIQCLRRD